MYESVISFWEQQAVARPNDLRTLWRTATALLNFEAHAYRAWPYFDRYLEATKDAPDGRGTGVQIGFALLAPAWDAWPAAASGWPPSAWVPCATLQPADP